MNAAIRFLRRVAPSAALSLALGLGSWQVASAQAPPAGPEILPQGPAVAAPVGPAGPAVAAPVGPGAGPAVAGPIGPSAGPGLVAADGPIVDGPPPGPALLHHFVYVERFPRYREMVEYRTELLLYEDNTFNLIYPEMGHCDFHDGEEAGPTTIVGGWGLRANRLSLQFDDGFVDYGFMSGPGLRFHGSRWTDLLAPPPPAAGPVSPAVAGPVGPGIGPQ